MILMIDCSSGGEGASGDLKIVVMPSRPCYLSTKMALGPPIAGVWVGTTLPFG